MAQFSGITRHTKHFLMRNSPQILSGLGILGIYATAIFAVKATPKTLDLIEEKRYDISVAEGKIRALTYVEGIKTCWKEYIPAAIISLISVACIWKSGRIHSQRELAMLSLYSLTETALREYQNKVREHFGNNKEQKVRDAISKDKIERYIPDSKEIIIASDGNILCYDVPSDRYFKSDIERIRRKENEFNQSLRTEMQLTLNDLYYELGLEGTKLGQHVGWDIERHILTFRFSSQLTSNGAPCLVLDYDIYPLRLDRL